MIIMKKVLVVIFIFSLVKGYSQKHESEYKKMIDSALTIMMQKMINPGGTSKNNDLYLLDENDRPYPYFHTSLMYFKSIDLTKASNDKRLKQGIKAWKIIPVLKGNRMTITIIDFRITYKNNNYNYANGGGSESVFEYSCDKNAWLLVASKTGGL